MSIITHAPKFPATDLANFKVLRTSVRNAKGSDRKIDQELYRLFVHNREDKRLRKSLDFTASLDTALDLLEHALPGWRWHGASWSIGADGQPGAKMQIVRPKLTTWSFFNEGGAGAYGEGSTPALALVDALLAAHLLNIPVQSEVVVRAA